LEKSRVSDSLKDALIKSPLDDKIFGLSINEVQKHLSQTPAPVTVNVSLSSKGDLIRASLRLSETLDFSKISDLLDKVQLAQEPMINN
jgi:hypothetical protein